MTADGPAPRPRDTSFAQLADERTDLAWNRSGLTLIACGILIARGLTMQHFARTNVAVGAVILSLGLVSYLVAAWHAARRFASQQKLRPAAAADLLPVALSVTAIGIAAFLLGLLFPA